MEASGVCLDESQRLGSWYPSLLGLAEYFRTLNPPNIKYCVHCLQAIFNFNPPIIIQARTHLQIGKALVINQNSKNVAFALSHLESAWSIAQTVSFSKFGNNHLSVMNNFTSRNCHSADNIKFEAVSVSAQICESQGQFTEAKQFLRKALEQSTHSSFWHCRLLFQLAQCEMEEGDHPGAISTLTTGYEFSHGRSEYARLLFLLSKAMVVMIGRKLPEAQQLMLMANSILEQWSPVQSHLKETIKVFYFLLETWQYLLTGQVKTVKPALKQLQQTIQTITSAHNEGGDMSQLNTDPTDMFQWLSKDHMCVLVYLVTVIHSMQAGHIDKAQKYTDKALIQIEKLKMTDMHPLLVSFQVMLLEHITMCRLITGHKSIAIQQIVQVCHMSSLDQKIRSRHTHQIHTLLGLYAMSINSMDNAEAQFKSALNSPDTELCSFISLNLALLYLRMNRLSEFNSVLESLDPGKMPTVSHGLRASTFYIRGLQAFFQLRHSDAKKFLRESLRMANTEDLNRLTSCSLVLLGHAFLSLGNSQEALNMVNPAMQLAAKIPDIHIQLWASAVLKDLYRILGNPQSEAESYRMHDSFSQTLLQDHFQSAQLAEHQLIQWTDGPCPFFQLPTSNNSQHREECMATSWNTPLN